ncbi:MAG: MarR family transcriptional regulator [Gammaproteobacteria bacterium]|nr:MarR family transcriptional regulator [Gammaproteobacteria bacterium]
MSSTRRRSQTPAPVAAAPSAADAGAPHHQGWLHAVSAADDPAHQAPALLLYRLLKLTNLISRPFFARDAQRYQISMNELRVLMTLAPLRVAASHELVDAAGMHPMNVSRAVATLRRHGRVQQRIDPDNRRRKLLQLTPEGLAVYRNLVPHVQQIATRLFATMSAEEISTLSRLIDTMTGRLESDPDLP